MHRIPAALMLFALFSHPIHADQSATFSCKATQGFAWNGQSQVTRERIDITIHPDHLDVEHELEINATASWNTPSHPNSLEIVGNLTVEKGTVMTGLLLWNGDQILKGKLQSIAMARRKYEEVVDRNVKDPPPPRDPALLEKVGENAYVLSIFPVTLNGSRKLRLRYVIPSAFRDGAHRIAFPHAFSNGATVTVRGGAGTMGYALTSVRMDGTVTTVKNEDAVTVPLTLEADAYQRFQPYRGWGVGSGGWLRDITPLFGSQEGSRLYTGTMRDSKGSPGNFAHFVFRPPAEFVDPEPGSESRLVAVVAAGSDSVRKEVAGTGDGLEGAEALRIFSREALEEGITWRLYTDGVLARESVEKPLVVRMEDGNQYGRTFGLVPFYPLVKTMPASLAASWGFIDSRYALLALEQDTLSAQSAEQYAKSGVPPLEPEDIYPEDGALDSIPLTAWMLQKNLNRDELLKPLALGPTGLPSGIRWSFRDGLLRVEVDAAARKPGLRVSLHGLDGRLLKEWGADDLAKGRLDWSPAAADYGAGICMLRIVSGSRTFSSRVVLR